MATTRTRASKLDQICADAVELAREAAEDASDVVAVGAHLGTYADAERVVTHTFAAEHPGYAGWRWSVTLVRASRAKQPTVNEVVLLPGTDSLLSPDWVPWAERVQAGDVTPGLLMPTPDDDPRLEPGFTGGDAAADLEPADATLARIVVAELGLGRERVLSPYGRDEAAERWLAGDGGPDNQMTKLAPGVCETCGFFVRLQGGLADLFGVCANVYAASDGRVVSVDHGCGAHSKVGPQNQAEDLPAPVWETIEWDEPISLFD
ncbi:DUF3027 domain-containing protein [Microlunatus ginsengisoli]|uniref:DUF3027 domain-containing protein n=1 Tax=Microlunatus ginsengisoli TaxID=363863 RepID=A0ABP7AWA0_9ACTN